MLKGTKNVTLNYQSVIGDETVIVMNATVPVSGRSTINKSIVNMDLYEANKRVCRQDMAAFDALVWEAEDEREATAAAQPETTTQEETTEEGGSGEA